MKNRILAIDVHYRENEAKSVCIAFEKWSDIQPHETYIKMVSPIEEYEPGAFYKRELPCIVEILKNLDLSTVQFVIIDGYVYLDNDEKAGLGHYVFEYLERKIPVIGVAKTSFHQNTEKVLPILRGDSQSPLYISSIGIELNEAADNIRHMAGEYRIPTLLKQLDSITKLP